MKRREPLTPEGIMPWGKHKGCTMGWILENDPAHLAHIAGQSWIARWPAVHGFIQSVQDELEEHVDSEPERRLEGFDSFEDYLKDAER